MKKQGLVLFVVVFLVVSMFFGSHVFATGAIYSEEGVLSRNENPYEQKSNNFVYLDTMEISDHDCYTGNQGDSFIDVLGTRNGRIDIHGNQMEHGLEAWIARWNFKKESSWAWIEYEIDAQYTQLSGKLTVISDCYNPQNFDTTIEILGDGVLLYTTLLSPGMEATQVEVDVSGVNTLRIYVYDNVAVQGGTSFGLWDFAVSSGKSNTDDEGKCTIENLQPIDFLALSSLAYKNFKKNDLSKTVNEYLKDYWDANWEQTTITYGELFSRLAEWEICFYKENVSNGFFAVAFKNKQNEILIAYRGSESIGKLLESEDARNDWLANDLPIILFNEITEKNQFLDAFSVYEKIEELFKPKEIVVTGHSLGGGLGDLVSARYGCRAETVNAISVLDVLYFNSPDQFGEKFYGVDLWKIKDHANQYDRLAGVYEEFFATQVKPYVAYKSLLPDSMSNWVKHHGLSSYVVTNYDGGISLTEEVYDFMPSWAISKWLPSVYPWGQSAIDLGVSQNDIFELGLDQHISRSSYGGNGNDIIKTSIWKDSLIGGEGADILDGGWGDDSYIYYKGHDVDTIYDVAGDDKLCLFGFCDSDSIEATNSSLDPSFIEVRCNGEIVALIYKCNRSYSLVTLDSFKVCVDRGNKKYDEYDITALFNRKNYDKRIIITCPVNVEILDAQGNVVYALKDGVIGSHYTEYGNFYVFEEENGEYGKVLDLIEGYSARVVGVDEGTMVASCWKVQDGVLSEEKKISEIPVTEGYTANIDTDDAGEIRLTEEIEETHTHIWDDGVVTMEPTCKQSGTAKYTCTGKYVCTMYVSTPMADHSYEDGKCQFCGLEQPLGVPGDANEDGKVNYQDALMVLRSSIGLEELSEEAKSLCDVDGKSGLSYQDALLILRASIGLEELS